MIEDCKKTNKIEQGKKRRNACKTTEKTNFGH